MAPIPGGLLHANVLSCALFSAVCGSSAATAATISTVAFPALEKRGYDIRLTLGSLAAGGTLGILIPPSITMIVYGVLVNASVGRLFAGGVIPGIILSMMYMVYIWIKAVRNPRLAPREARVPSRVVLLGLRDLWPVIILSTIILGGIFAGIATPTEAAAVGSSAALVIALAMRGFSWRMLRESLSSTLETTCMIMFIIVGASMFSSFLAVSGAPRAFSALLLGWHLPRLVMLSLIYFLYLFLGCFIDGLSMMIMTIPVVFPLVIALGFDPIWFGIILVILIEVGLLTPPVGINLFVLQGISKKPLIDVVSGSYPFFMVMILGIIVFTVFPSLVLWLPDIIFGP